MRHYKRTIFRRNAWAAYVSKYEQTIQPRLVTPPVFVFCWILSGLLLSASTIAWWVEVPLYASGSGILLAQPISSLSGEPVKMALIFLPANQLMAIQKGETIPLQVSGTGLNGNGQVERVEPGLISPQEARTRYMLNSASASLITGPSMVVFARVAPPLSASIYTESIISAQVPIGTRRLLTLLFE